MAIPHAIQAVLCTACPARKEMMGVITTDVCVKKAARALGTDKRPRLTRPCAKKLKTANSRLLHQRVDDDDDRDDGSAETWDDGVAMLLVFALGRCNKKGIKHKAANQPRAVDNADAEGGSGKAYTMRSVTFKVPYRNAVVKRSIRPINLAVAALL